MYKQAQMEDEAEPRIVPIGEAELQNRDLKKRLVLLIFAPIAARRRVALLRNARLAGPGYVGRARRTAADERALRLLTH